MVPRETSLRWSFLFNYTDQALSRIKNFLWARGDSNSHGLLHTLLKRARLPVTPRALLHQYLKSSDNYRAKNKKRQKNKGW